MKDTLFRMPRDNRAVERDGRLTPPYQHYLAGIERLSERQAPAVPNTGGATLAELEATVNDLKVALRAAALLKT